MGWAWGRHILTPFSACFVPIVISAAFAAAAEETLVSTDNAPAQTRAITFTYLPPNCLEAGNGSINLVQTLFDHFEHAPGSAVVTGHGFGTLFDGNRYLFAEGNVADAKDVFAFFDEPIGARREVLEPAFPILTSPYEVNFQYPTKNHFDWMRILERKTGARDDFADTVPRNVVLARWTNSRGTSLLALELNPDAPLTTDRTQYARKFGGLIRIDTPDDKSTLYVFAKENARGSRIVSEIARLQGTEEEGSLLLHPGDALDNRSNALANHCAASLRKVGVDAVVPREGELAIGVDGLGMIAKQHELPYVAANLLDARSPKNRPFPRYLMQKIDGLDVAIVGIVGSDQLEQLPASVRSQWSVEDPRLSLTTVADDIKRQLGRRPDLTIALVGAGGDAYASVMATRYVDIVVADHTRYDLVETREELVLTAVGLREHTRNPRPLLSLRSSPNAVGHVRIEFERKEPLLASLSRITHETHPILEEGPLDAEFETELRALEEDELATFSQVVLPDVAPLVANHPELNPLIWGDRILQQRGFRKYPRHFPARFSDPLWMRLVANALMDVTTADVALTHNLPRSSDMVGPISRGLMRNWLAGSDSLRVVELFGADVVRVMQVLARQDAVHGIPPEGVLFAVGIEPKKRLIHGQPIHPKMKYRIATTDFVLAMADLHEVFAQATVHEKFVRDGTRLVTGDTGEPVLVRDALWMRLSEWADASGTFDPAHTSRVEEALLDTPETIRDLWTFSVDAFSLHASRYANSTNIGEFAATRQTRATTPNHFSLGNRTNLALIYEGKSLGWETRLKTALDRMDLRIPGANIPPQEQSDDIVASTEIRLNAMRVVFGDAGMRIVPFLQTAFDSEFTATPNPDAGEDATFPHQKILRGTAGLVLYPGMHFKEFRLGGAFQWDASESNSHTDFGASASYRINIPLFNILTFQSSLDALYLVPDSDDRATDLRLYASWVNRLAAAITSNISMFIFADGAIFVGKADAQSDPGASWILGGGLEFSALFRL